MWCTILFIASIALVQRTESVAEFGDCSGAKQCDAGLKCFSQTQYYSQCLKTCPSGWQCSTGGVTASTSKPSTTSKKPAGTTTGKPSISNGNRKALTNDCSFGFGAAFDGNSRDYSQVDFGTIWIGSTSAYVSYQSVEWLYLLVPFFPENLEQTLTNIGTATFFVKCFPWVNYQCKPWFKE